MLLNKWFAIGIVVLLRSLIYVADYHYQLFSFKLSVSDTDSLGYIIPLKGYYCNRTITFMIFNFAKIKELRFQKALESLMHTVKW